MGSGGRTATLGRPQVSAGPTHPVVGVSWDDANAFCAWLTQKERGEGKISESQSYRLPTDSEWSVAVGLHESSSGTPQDKDTNPKNEYSLMLDRYSRFGRRNDTASLNVVRHEETSPVGSSDASALGLYDMGGNVWQWCEDSYDGSEQQRVLRGGSWSSHTQRLLFSIRGCAAPQMRNDYVGFRCVLVCGSVP